MTDFNGHRQMTGKAFVAKLKDAVEYVGCPQEIIDTLKVGFIWDMPPSIFWPGPLGGKALLVDCATFDVEAFRNDPKFANPWPSEAELAALNASDQQQDHEDQQDQAEPAPEIRTVAIKRAAPDSAEPAGEHDHQNDD